MRFPARRVANIETEDGYRTGFQEVVAHIIPDILGTVGMICANKPDEVTLSCGLSLINGMALCLDNALDAATDFLGPATKICEWVDSNQLITCVR